MLRTTCTALALALVGLACAHAEAVAVAPNTKIICPQLKGLTFVARSQDIVQAGVAKTGITISGLPMLDAQDFRDQMIAELGLPVTMASLDKISHEVIEYYRQHQHPLVDATIPEQNIENGVIQVIVSEYRVDEVRTQGNKWFSSKVITAPITLRHGDTVNSNSLINQLDAANDNPFRRVNLVYQPSSQPGYTDLVLNTQDRLPLSVTSGFDNSGTPVTSRSRWNMGATWGNAFWNDQTLSFNMSTSDNFFTGASRPQGEPGGPSFRGESLTWSMPIRGRDSISLSASYDRSVPNVGGDFGLVGKSYQVSSRYNYALPRSAKLVQNLQAGFDYKSTNNNLDFGGTTITRNRPEVDQFTMGYSGNLLDSWGSSSLSTSIFFSPGNLTSNNTDGAFQPAAGQSGRPMASAHYTYWRADFDRLTKVAKGVIWSSRVMGQESTANLLYTEQLAGGGPDVLRGYDPNQVLGDRGVILSNELRSPAFAKPGEFQTGQIQVLGFWDWAHLSSVHPQPYAINHLNASSVGIGVRYRLRNNFSGNFDYGWQLQHLPNAGPRDHLMSLALTATY